MAIALPTILYNEMGKNVWCLVKLEVEGVCEGGGGLELK